MDSGFQVLNSSICKWNIGFRIPIVSGIPDSLCCIPDSKTQDSGFHKQKFPDSGIRILLHGGALGLEKMCFLFFELKWRLESRQHRGDFLSWFQSSHYYCFSY